MTEESSVLPPKKSKCKYKPVASEPPPSKDQPLDARCRQVIRKLKSALDVAQSGATPGALIVAVDEEGGWTADLAGQLSFDKDLLYSITCRLFSAGLAAQQT